MALKIVKANEPINIKAIWATIYAQPGLGKTSLAFTSSNPLLLDFDSGIHRAADRKDAVQISKWSDIAEISARDVADYDTIVIDTVGQALDSLSEDILLKNHRHGYGGTLNQQGWCQLNVRFSAFLRRVRSFEKDVILIAHMDEKYDGEQRKERLKIQGGSKETILIGSDIIGRISIHNKERQLIFSPTEIAFGKDPAGLDSVVIPDASSSSFSGFMAGVIETVKNSINQMSEAQREALGEQRWFEENLKTATDDKGINALQSRAKKAGKTCSAMLVQRAKDLGLEFDAENRKYVYLEELEPPLVDETPEAA